MPESTVFLMDNMELMARYSDLHFDLAIPDPPYFADYKKEIYPGSAISTTGIKRNRFQSKHWGVPEKPFYDELRRVSRHYILWGANYYSFLGTPFKTPRKPEIDQWLADHPKNWIVWDKDNEHSSFNHYELAYTSLPIDTVVFKYTWNGMLQGDMKHKEKRIHPTQKPVKLYKWLFKHFAKPTDLILDTHVGSGSSRIAAYDLKLDYIGAEADEQYFYPQEKRFRNHIAQIKLF